MRPVVLVVVLFVLSAASARSAVNLDATVTPPGWSFPVVPRNAPGATAGAALVSPQLEGGDTTWISFAIQQAGPDLAGAFRSQLVLDGETVLGTFDSPAGLAPGLLSWLDTGPYVAVIGGGRHTLSTVADADGQLAEGSEADNTWSRQFVWKAPGLFRDEPQTRPLPPLPGTGAQPNADGFRVLRPSPYAWGCALVPRAAGDDATLRVYLDYANSGSGFGVPLATSNQPGSAVDFVVGHYSGTPTEYFPAAIRAAVGAHDSLVIDQTDSQQHTSSTNSASFVNQPLPTNRLLDVFEGFLVAGRSYRFVLSRVSGASDLAISVFPGTPGGIWPRGAAASHSSAPQSEELDTLTFVPATTDWHPIVVHRTTSAGLADTCVYSLSWIANGALDAADPVAPRLSLAPPRPNPARGSTTCAFALATAGDVVLELVDVHGRRVRTLAGGRLSAGAHERRWDGRGENGERLPAGLYWLRLAHGGESATQRVVLLP